MRIQEPEYIYPHPELPPSKFGRRPLLLAFKGKVLGMGQVWWQHRWMASEYWEPAPDVVVDVVCKPDVSNHAGNNYSTPAYAELILNATFFFCPGGGSIGSYRFSEALGLGAIPVVTSDFVTPFFPDMDWSGCVVRVSEARIVDLPRLLRNVQDEEIVERQRECKRLFDATIGWTKHAESGHWQVDRQGHMLPTALLIWSKRIQNHFQFQDYRTSLMQEVAAAATNREMQE